MNAKERRVWLQDYKYYLRLGYPTKEAQQRAWDHYSVNKVAYNNRFKQLFA